MIVLISISLGLYYYCNEFGDHVQQVLIDRPCLTVLNVSIRGFIICARDIVFFSL